MKVTQLRYFFAMDNHLSERNQCLPTVTLSVQDAIFLCAIVAIPFVGLFYVSPASIAALPRNHPKHVAYRIACTTLTSITSTILFNIYLGGFDFSCFGMALTAAYAWKSSVLIPVSMVLVLYAAEIVFKTVTYYKTNDIFSTFLSNVDTEPILFFRNIIFAPIVEEFTFRALIIGAMRQASRPNSVEIGETSFIPYFTTKELIFWTPLVFSAAHVSVLHILLSEYYTKKLESKTIDLSRYTTYIDFIGLRVLIYVEQFCLYF